MNKNRNTISEKDIEISDILRTQGIKSKGFGTIPQYLCKDLDLHIVAKSIYAYFCTYAGGGNTALPARKTIIDHLGIGKDRYYKYLKVLVDQGYLKVNQIRREGQRFGKNIYTLVEKPHKFNIVKDNESLEKIYSKIRMFGLDSAGYGFIPKLAMIDKRINIISKGIYAYFCSLSGSGNSTFPKREMVVRHLGISDSTYQRYLKELVSYNYITVMQRKDKAGKFSVNDYYINSYPDLKASSVKNDEYLDEVKVKISDIEVKERLSGKNPDTEIEEIPGSKNPDTGIEEIPCSKNPDTGIEEVPSSKNSDTEIEAIPSSKNPDTEIEEVPSGKNPDTEIEEIPCSKNSDTGNADTQNKDTNSITIKSITNNIITHSLNAGTCSRLVDAITENDIKAELESRRGVPFEYKADKSKMKKTIHLLTEWVLFSDKGFNDPLILSAYKLFNVALIEMCCSIDQMKLKGSFVTYANVIEKLNSMIQYTDQGEVTIYNFMMDTIYLFHEATKEREITNYVKYMKSFIWDAMHTFEIRWNAKISRIR